WVCPYSVAILGHGKGVTMSRFLAIPILVGVGALVLSICAAGFSAVAQQTCQEIDAVVLQCPDVNKISGDPPDCFCDAAFIRPPLELSCDRNYGCGNDSFVGAGDWPECFCRKKRDVQQPGSNGGGESIPGAGTIGGSLGGVETCKEFFECPS